MAMSWTLMFSWDMLRSRSGSWMSRKRGRSWDSQLMSSRCSRQVCTQDRAGSSALEGWRGVLELIPSIYTHTDNYIWTHFLWY